ncbi:MAG: N-acetylmuramic acid 6-phosphate etherase [Lentisphaerae bacterium ADurb.Bin242]|nr:MAG: N-acetylmuramic acid 6-phosphate etherase [Lentisphaerae bacterium ADurb.Bin242]
MSEKALKKAMDFMENEKQFHLGFLPTEQSNPLTKNLDREFASATGNGVKCLQRVDRNVSDMAKRIFRGKEFKKLVSDGVETLRNGGKIVFSGCGATGRLSILLECMWRDCCFKTPAVSRYANQVFSIMTGGDYALVRSVEFFEDYQQFGRRQVQETGMGGNDMLVAITEGGETSSVLGTVFEALDRGAKVVLMFNNPADLLSEHLERSRKAICDPRVCVLDLHCGPMALAGSTRMQATTSEQLVAGGALESVMNVLLGKASPDYAADFEKLLDNLEAPAAREAIAGYIDFEAGIYRNKGLVTYFADDYLLDIFTDTTERSPTFMLPPFRKNDDKVSPRPWAFVKNPLFTTPEVWDRGMHRPLRCLGWTVPDYEVMGAPEAIRKNPPKIHDTELLKFEVGKESPSDRAATGKDAAVLVTVGDRPGDVRLFDAFAGAEAPFAFRKHLAVGGSRKADFRIPCELPDTPLHLMEHMAVKLVLNTVSTGVMAVLGRVTGNWMSWVDVTNKKLMDRGIRLISEIGGLDYKESCIRLFEAVEELESSHVASDEKVSAVQFVLKKMGR